MNDLDDAILLQREMTAELIVGNEPDHADFKVGNRLARRGEFQNAATGLSIYDEYALNLWAATEVCQRTGAQPDGVLSIAAYNAMWERLLREQRRDLAEMLRDYPGAKMGRHGR